MEKVLVTGSNGFIASNLIPTLFERGYDAYGVERYVTGRYVQGLKRNMNVIEANLNDHDRIREVICDLKPEYVLHLAAISAVSYSYDHPFEIIDTDFKASVNLAEVCRKYNSNLKQFLFAGTSEEYGNQTLFPIAESAELRPNSPYAVSKVAFDCYLRYMRDAYGFPMTILRPFNTYGRMSNTHFVVERIISQMLMSEEVHLGDPMAVRDLLYMDDHVGAYLACLGNAGAIGETFNFCMGVGMSIRELAETISTLMDYDGEIVWNTIPPRPLDIKVLIGNNSKANRTLGWRPLVGLETGLKRTIEKLGEKKWHTAGLNLSTI